MPVSKPGRRVYGLDAAFLENMNRNGRITPLPEMWLPLVVLKSESEK
jgi:hypothetical protein